MRFRARTLLAVFAVVGAFTPAHAASTPQPQNRSVEPVILTGQQFPTWSAGPDPTAREPEYPHNYGVADLEANLPAPLQSECYKPGENPYDDEDNGDHNCYQSSRLPHNPSPLGAPVNKLLGFRYDDQAHAFVEIPFQVDERFTRYITNNGSGFAFYSGTDAEETYAWDREGFRYSSDESQYVDGGDPCKSMPAKGSTLVDGNATTPDPVQGLDDNDELAFMYSDTGSQAPVGTTLPAGIESSYEVAVADPTNPGAVSYVYVMKATADGPTPHYNASNGYLRYDRDANADTFLYSQSSYGDYGAAPKGPYCKADGTRDTSHGAIAQRRPGDGAWVRSDRYAFRYDGRWLMTELHISNDTNGLAGVGLANYGPDIIDQWKARAFQQRPGGQTPCCGYEEEVNNWGGSSILMGERSGPVRAIRAAWGADSSTNNVKTETFYRNEIRFADNLRVHVIPPFDGIYVQWDYNAGAVEKYYNPIVDKGVAIDGQNDEVFGNTNWHVANDRIEISDDDPNPVTGEGEGVIVPGTGGDPNDCTFGSDDGVCNDIDQPDPTFSGPLGDLNWEEVAGPNGSLVTRWTIKRHTGGDAYGLIAQPYYRDDSCFDDGTGQNPGPHLRSRNVDNGAYASWTDPSTGIAQPRQCWTPNDALTGDRALDAKYWQGDIGTHGLHLNVIVDSDNAQMTVPVDEIDSEQRMVVLAGDPGNVGEQYGRGTEFPLAAVARPFA